MFRISIKKNLKNREGRGEHLSPKGFPRKNTLFFIPNVYNTINSLYLTKGENQCF